MLGVVLATFVTTPLIAGPRMMSRTLHAWTAPNPELDAFHWLRDHTASNTRCVVPIDRQDVFMGAERAVVVNWQAIRYDNVEEWRRRNLRVGRRRSPLLGSHAPGRVDGRRGGDLESLRGAYDALTRAQIVAVARRYQATCIVATTRYDLPVLHRVDGVRVYRVPHR